jgi:hypothetical protein
MNEYPKKIVNLQSKPAPQPERPEPLRAANSYPPLKEKRMRSRAEEIDRVFDENKADSGQDSLHKIDRPLPRRDNSRLIQWFFLFLLVMIVGVVSIYFFKQKGAENKGELTQAEDGAARQANRWYSVQLTSGETYYGFIKDTASDPIVLEKVYYNYDQLNKEGTVPGEEKEDKSIRLVKRGKEAHGPDGSMEIVRAQALYMEPLAEDSNILKAILEYEK